MPQLIQDDLSDIQDKIQLNMPEPVAIHFDEGQLRQVLINLVRNAIRHNDRSTPHIELNIYYISKYIHIDVRDFGLGVAEHDRSALFQPFFSTEITGNWFRIVPIAQFCEANQAKLTYVEQKEQGACFRVSCLAVTV